MAHLKHPDSRSTIHMEDSIVISHHHYDDRQHVLRLHCPQCASHAVHGQFVHLQCDRSLLLRRPFSIMRARPDEGWIDLLYKEVGQGTMLLAKQAEGSVLNLLGSIGNPFILHEDKPIRILIGGGVGIPPMIFVAETIRQQYPSDTDMTYAFMGSEISFPFTVLNSELPVPGVTAHHAIEDMENISIPSRLASLRYLTGCYRGHVTELAEKFLQTLSPERLQIAEIFSCGPRPMLYATKRLAMKYNIDCQISMEEYMACATGGCAGCNVKITGPDGPAMKRVCVDGPVFDASLVEL